METGTPRKVRVLFLIGVADLLRKFHVSFPEGYTVPGKFDFVLY
jgi:hypothetical protein